MTSTVKNKPESSLGDLLLACRRTLMEEMKKEGLTDDLTFSQMEALRFVGTSGTKTMKSIAEYLKITPPSATVLVAELEKKGLIQRLEDKDDRRVVSIAFTEKMQKLFTAISRRKESIFKKMFSKLTPKDRKELERIIKIVIKQ